MKAVSNNKIKSSVSQLTAKVVLGVWVTLVLFGCAGSTVKQNLIPPIQDMKAQEWVTKDNFLNGKNKEAAFYGVGLSDYKDVVLQRTSADNHARNAIAKSIQSFTASLEKEYRAVTTGGNEGQTSYENLFETAQKSFTSNTLLGVIIVDHWQHPATGTLYSLAKLDLENYKKMVENLKETHELDKKMKAYIKENADRMHEELQTEEEKRQGK